MNKTVNKDILFVSPVRRDQSALRRIAGADFVTPAANCRRAVRQLSRNRFAVVLCDSELPDGSWLDILDLAVASGDPPAFIVTSRLADDLLWSRVLHLGGWDVLATPFREAEVCHSLESARAHRYGPGRSRCRTAGA